MSYLYLFLAIIFEISGTMLLNASYGFSKILPGSLSIASYAVAFFFMSIVMKTMPMGIVYAIWSGLGIVFISTLGYFVFKQKLDLPAICGIILIVTGVLVINIFSKTTTH